MSVVFGNFLGILNLNFYSIFAALNLICFFVYRQMQRTPWTEHVSNKEILKKILIYKIIILKIRNKRLKFLGHNEERGLGKINTHRTY